MTNSRLGTALCKRQTLLICLALAIYPSAARADAGTPLILFSLLHLIILNFVIGVYEAGILTRWYQATRLRARTTMVFANYFSAWVGAGILAFVTGHVWHIAPSVPPLYKAGPIMIALLIITWALTVFLEWPFIAFIFGKEMPARKSLKISCVVQTASYVPLVAIYMLISPTSFITYAHLERNPSFTGQPVATVYYLDLDGRTVRRIGTDGSHAARVMTTGVPAPEYARLDIFKNAKSDAGDLCLLRDARNQNTDKDYSVTVLKEAVCTSADIPHTASTGPKDIATTWMNFYEPVDLRPADARKSTVTTHFWATQGIFIDLGKGADYYSLAFDTPFAEWFCRNATVLSGDRVVFQLGLYDNAQIVILDMHSRKISVLAMGQGPVVVTRPQ